MLVLVASCAPAVRTRQIAATVAASTVRSNVVSTSHLSSVTMQELRMAALDKDPCMDGCYPRLQMREGSALVDVLYARSELAMAHAAKLGRKGEPSVQANLEAARFALSGILLPDCNSPVNFVCDDFKIFYISAVIGILSGLQNSGWVPSNLDSTGGFNLVVSSPTADEDPRRYESIIPAALVSFEGLSNRLVRYGLGVPLSACRPRDPSLPNDAYLPRVGTCLPLTAVIDFPGLDSTGRSEGQAVLSLHNAFTTDTVVVSGREFPLAANFSAPFASLVERTGLSNYSGLFKTLHGGEELLEKTGFFTVEPYRTNRIPLVFVHGLFSSPITWVNLQNDLMGDPFVRKHYQIFNYLYPTNLPILLNAETFRNKLDDLKRHLAEGSPGTETGAAQPPGMVIIAHSMGGLLTKTAVVQDSEPVRQYLWSSPEKLQELDPETRAVVDRLFNFRARPYVGRVIFVAVPFRGSNIADDWIGWLGRTLVGIPRFVVRNATDVQARIRALARPELREDLAQQDLTSVKSLSPHNPVLQALAQALVDKRIPFHLIEGDRGLGGGPNSSDGVVPYKSSHLEGAESELVVPAGHAAFVHPLAVQEIKRILHLHVERPLLSTGTSSNRQSPTHSGRSHQARDGISSDRSPIIK